MIFVSIKEGRIIAEKGEATLVHWLTRSWRKGSKLFQVGRESISVNDKFTAVMHVMFHIFL